MNVSTSKTSNVNQIEINERFSDYPDCFDFTQGEDLVFTL